MSQTEIKSEIYDDIIRAIGIVLEKENPEIPFEWIEKDNLRTGLFAVLTIIYSAYEGSPRYTGLRICNNNGDCLYYSTYIILQQIAYCGEQENDDELWLAECIKNTAGCTFYHENICINRDYIAEKLNNLLIQYNIDSYLKLLDFLRIKTRNFYNYNFKTDLKGKKIQDDESMFSNPMSVINNTIALPVVISPKKNDLSDLVSAAFNKKKSKNKK